MRCGCLLITQSRPDQQGPRHRIGSLNVHWLVMQDGKSPLHSAAARGDTEVASVLITGGASTAARDKVSAWQSPCLSRQEASIVQLLCESVVVCCPKSSPFQTQYLGDTVIGGTRLISMYLLRQRYADKVVSQDAHLESCWCFTTQPGAVCFTIVLHRCSSQMMILLMGKFLDSRSACVPL